MKPIRVLVVEDSPTLRRYLVAVLARHDDLLVVGETDNGEDAVRLCGSLRPDVVTLDVLMPDMDGARATELIMAEHPTPILVVSSTVDRNDPRRAFDVLAAGAVDAQDKPATMGDPAWEQRFVANVRLVSRIKVITHVRAAVSRVATPREAFAAVRGDCEAGGGTASPPVRPRLIAIGASTGGPHAIAEVLKPLTRWCDRPVLVVLHVAEGFGDAWRLWLAEQCATPVVNAQHGQPVPPVGRPAVIVAPPGCHLVLDRDRLLLDGGPERNACRPSIDVLFASLAALGAGATACLLTGMGRDGAAGLLAMRRAGAFTIAQDEATCVVYGMPKEAAQLGAAREILPLPQIEPRLRRLIDDGRSGQAQR